MISNKYWREGSLYIYDFDFISAVPTTQTKRPFEFIECLIPESQNLCLVSHLIKYAKNPQVFFYRWLFNVFISSCSLVHLSFSLKCLKVFIFLFHISPGLSQVALLLLLFYIFLIVRSEHCLMNKSKESISKKSMGKNRKWFEWYLESLACWFEWFVFLCGSHPWWSY